MKKGHRSALIKVFRPSDMKTHSVKYQGPVRMENRILPPIILSERASCRCMLLLEIRNLSWASRGAHFATKYIYRLSAIPKLSSEEGGIFDAGRWFRTHPIFHRSSFSTRLSQKNCATPIGHHEYSFTFCRRLIPSPLLSLYTRTHVFKLRNIVELPSVVCHINH